MDTSKCIVLTPVMSMPELANDIQMAELVKLGYELNRIYGCPYLDMVRSVLAHRAISDGYEELMWIDDDIIFRPEDVERLRSHDLPLVCGLYPFRSQNGGVAVSLMDDCKEIMFGPTGGLIEIRGAATGFFYTKREVYDAIAEKFNLPLCHYETHGDAIPYFHEMIHYSDSKNRYSHMGEDLSFCERARQCGYRVYADTTIRLHHIGPYAYTWEDMSGPRPKGDGFLLKFSDR